MERSSSTTPGLESYFALACIQSTQYLRSYRRIISKIDLARQCFSQYTPDNLATSCLWKVCHNQDPLRCCKRANGFSYVQRKILLDVLESFLERNNSINCLASQLVRDTDNSSFRNARLTVNGGQQVLAESVIKSTWARVTNLQCSRSTLSISEVERRWPETLITSSTRPRIQ